MTIIKHNEDVMVEVVHGDMDQKYTQTRTIEFSTKVYDHYNKRWLEPRTFKMMLSSQELEELGMYLIMVSKGRE